MIKSVMKDVKKIRKVERKKPEMSINKNITPKYQLKN